MTTYMNTNGTDKYESVGEFVSIFQRAGVWHVYYRDAGKARRRSLHTRSKKEARRRALAIERDLVNGQVVRPAQAPLLEKVISDYISHLEALGRSPRTITKYQYCFKLVQQLAAKRGVKQINQIDFAFIDAFRAERMKNNER
jgi:hypothetical protein